MRDDFYMDNFNRDSCMVSFNCDIDNINKTIFNSLDYGDDYINKTIIDSAAFNNAVNIDSSIHADRINGLDEIIDKKLDEALKILGIQASKVGGEFRKFRRSLHTLNYERELK